MCSTYNKHPTNFNYYYSFRYKSLGNYFILSELKVSASSRNEVQTYYYPFHAKILWFSAIKGQNVIQIQQNDVPDIQYHATHKMYIFKI